MKNVFFKYSKTQYHNVFTILGIKIKISNGKLGELQKKQENYLEIRKLFQSHINANNINSKVFERFKNSNYGKVVVLCGSGPSLSKYKPIQNAKHCSLNRAFEIENIPFDYSFVCDWNGIKQVHEKFKNYKGNNCIKFLGTGMSNRIEEIPKSYISSFENENFIIDQQCADLTGKIDFALDLRTQPVAIGNTVAIPAMQFLLWTNPKKIYIVGCDCSNTGHFCKLEDDYEKIYQKSIANNCYKLQLSEWIQLKNFADTYYPDTEIISINPVGLKGLFKDEFTL